MTSLILSCLRRNNFLSRFAGGLLCFNLSFTGWVLHRKSEDLRMYKWQLVTITWVSCTRNRATSRRPRSITNLLWVLHRKSEDLRMYKWQLVTTTWVMFTNNWVTLRRLRSIRNLLWVLNRRSYDAGKDSLAPVKNDGIDGMIEISFESSAESSKSERLKNSEK